MPSLPTGTVTFLFTDIEGATTLLQRLGDRRFAEVLAEHQRLLREAFAKGSGQEIDTQGDAFLVAFSRARDAVATAVAAQQSLMKHTWPDNASIRVRMGLHSGEPISNADRYVGVDVHRAARIGAAAHGGQILLSDAVSGLAARDLHPSIRLRDLGLHRLKDLREPEHLLQVVHPDLPADFPPVQSLDAIPNNLPLQLTSFIGREREKAEVNRLLSATRLLTLTGSEGAGKTRLALQAAAEALEQFPGGVWFVELAPLSDSSHVMKAVASSMGVPEQPGRRLTDTLADALRFKSALVILDNCEHLVGACAHLASVLLGACPNLRILTTSREALALLGETTWRVPSLSVPDPRHLPTLDRFMQYDAVRLFVNRAVASEPQFAVTSTNASAVAQICHRLDGIPFAIELAAARIKVLAAEQIATRLDDRFRLLTGGSRTALPRQQTLRGAMDWSYDLLSPKERTALHRMSVFAGRWTIDAAEAVCSGDSIEAADILDLLTQLVNKSLVVVDTQGGEARYRLLETVREYGRARLQEAGEADGVQRRHRDWYLGLAERAEPELHGPNQIAWLERLEENHDNLRAALAWSKADAGADAGGLRLAAALCDFWDIHGHFAEGRAWLDEMLALHKGAAPVLRVKALNRVGHLAHRQGDYAQVPALCGEALTLSQAEGDTTGSAEALHYLAHAAEGADDLPRAADLLERSVTLHRAARNTFELGRALNCLANTARAEANYPNATGLYEEALTLFHNLGDKQGKEMVLHNLGYAVLRQGNRQRSWALFRESLALAEELGDRRVMIKCLVGLAGASADTTRAATLFGAAETLMSTASIRLEPFNRRDCDHYMTVTKSQLAEPAFSKAWAEGRTMTLEQAIEYALAPESN
ncbi:MAG TPA: tetratricopeptide repeat protein [bacterium]|nr:tetratricopeptide repeat protein [bacterium]